MLVSGAEVNRVEDSVKRMCTAFGAVRTDVFIITSSMVVTIHTADGAIVTQTRRINSIGTNIDRLHRLNALSRDICAKRPTLDALRAKITEILSDKPYPFIVELFACAAVVSAFTLFFGGGIVEAIVSFIVGIMVKMLSRLTDIMLMNKMFAKFICTFFASAVAYGAVKLSICRNGWKKLSRINCLWKFRKRSLRQFIPCSSTCVTAICTKLWLMPGRYLLLIRGIHRHCVWRYLPQKA